MRVCRFPCRKDARDIGFHALVDLDVPQLAHLQLTFEHFCVRGVTDEDEQPVCFVNRLFAGFNVFQPNRFEFIRPDHLGDDGIQNEIDLGMFLGSMSAGLGWHEIPRGDEQWSRTRHSA